MPDTVEVWLGPRQSRSGRWHRRPVPPILRRSSMLLVGDRGMATPEVENRRPIDGATSKSVVFPHNLAMTQTMRRGIDAKGMATHAFRGLANPCPSAVIPTTRASDPRRPAHGLPGHKSSRRMGGLIGACPDLATNSQIASRQPRRIRPWCMGFPPARVSSRTGGPLRGGLRPTSGVSGLTRLLIDSAAYGIRNPFHGTGVDPSEAGRFRGFKVAKSGRRPDGPMARWLVFGNMGLKREVCMG